MTADGRRQDMGLGVFPHVGLADARKAAWEARVLLDSGITPFPKKAAKEPKPTTKPTTFKLSISAQNFPPVSVQYFPV